MMRDRLNRRQREVYDAIIEGLTAPEIAERIEVTEKCVKYHKANIFRILQLKSSNSIRRAHQREVSRTRRKAV